MKGLYNLNNKLQSYSPQQVFISEISLAELKFGVANSIKKTKNATALSAFLQGVNILPIYEALDVYAEEKTRLRKSGLAIDEFDLLIGASAIAHNMILVTNNVRHLKTSKV